MPNQLDPYTLAYYHARHEHAYRLHDEGVFFKDIGLRLGVTGARAWQMDLTHARRLRREASNHTGSPQPAHA